MDRLVQPGTPARSPRLSDTSRVRGRPHRHLTPCESANPGPRNRVGTKPGVVHSLPHRATPATVYTSRPKADPTTRIDTHNRVRTDRVDQAGSITLRVNGRLHHIGVGRIHYRTLVLILAQAFTLKIT